MGLKEKIAAAGVVGCGGAGFPTALKLDGKFEYLIINGVECEPLLRTDRWLMCNRAEDIVEAVSEVKRELDIPNAVIALKHDYTEEIDSLKRAIASAGVQIGIHEMESYYPAGDEQMIVYEVTGRIIPSGGIPGKVGAVVDNVGTMVAVYDALRGIPFTHKYLTVAGDVNKPTVLRVPVGTSFRECIEQAGGAVNSRYAVVSGGPMMGRRISFENLERETVTKTTSGILVLPEDGWHGNHTEVNIRKMLNRAASACIQCSFCTQLCPRALVGHPLAPHRIMRKMAVSADISSCLDDRDIRNAALCCECGICEVYACPMGLQPREINSLIKKELAVNGIRYTPEPDRELKADPDRELRKAPSRKVAARLGLSEYYDRKIKNIIEYEGDVLRIPLKMNIGAPSVPAVREGDRVKAGELVASAAEKGPGAAIHAGISGTVSLAGNMITITKERN